MTDPTVVQNLMRRFRDKGLFDLPSKEGDLTGYAETHLRGLSQKKPQEVLDAMVAEMASGSRVPRLSLVSVTFTPATAAACGSRILPETVPVVNCAAARGISIPSTSAMTSIARKVRCA